MNADYADYVSVDQSDAEGAFQEASRFIEKMKEVRDTLVLQN